jgi:branched-chain amino acid transport system permease protein
MTQATEQVAKADLRDQAGREAAIQVRDVGLGQALRLGLLGGITTVFISAIGMIEAFAGRIIMQPFLTLSFTALLLIPLVFGYLAGKKPPEVEGLTRARTGPRNVLAGLLAGVLTGVLTGLFVLVANAIDLRDIFIAISPRLLNILTFDQSPSSALVLLVLVGGVLGALGSLVAIAPGRWRRPLLGAFLWTLTVGLLEGVFQQVLRGLRLEAVNNFLFSPLGGLEPAGALTIFVLVFALYVVLERRRGSVSARLEAMSDRERRRTMIIGVVALLIVLAILPQIVGVFLSEVLVNVGIYLLMGLGLNIVVGFAGLLDLGYVAFFAVGAYVTAVLTSPSSPFWAPQLTFWVALPFVVLVAALAGIMVGTPVLRMRGDYLAIVTLGFGEIARLLFVSEWLAPYVGGAQGILSIPKVTIGAFEARTPPQLFYLVMAFVLLTIYVSWALKNSRIGRAWMAMREDEPVAEVIGIDIVQAKLSAFVVGAVLASFGGAIFATKIGSIFPNSFEILVSITVLVLIIVGGMGSIPGVIVGALVLVGLPELLREFSEFRLLFYGALLIYMMLKKPEGFIPAKERMRELHQEEMLQDSWLRETEPYDRETPVDARGRDPDAGLI